MERYLKIPTNDGYEIKGVLNWEQKSQKLIIIVHGLTGSMTEAHYYAAKEYFIQRWYAVLRFNLYSWGKKNRKLHTTNIAEHNRDIQIVLNFASHEYSEIYLLGHSLAWPSIVQINSFPQNLRKIILWDPAFDTSGTILRCVEKHGECYFNPRNGKLIQISLEMFSEINENRHIEFLERLPFPKQKFFIIYAGDHGNSHLVDKTDALGIESTIIEWANHGFTQEGKYGELFEKTLEFLEK